MGIAIYQRTGPEGTPAVVRIESTGELTETLDLGQVRDVVIVDNETLLVLNASERPDGQATVTFWQDGVPVKTEQHPIIAFRNVDYSSGSILAATQSREDTTPVAYAVYAF
jgi:hypothetical protein